ncbi:MAG TPA: TetR/AcrR family transcriptional regulator [Amycolatopsis sp.]|nr:TetR/AcrR family transcriptional regulator [Amycolatopsis sp.]
MEERVRESVRRSSYGPLSPTVGENGSRTRERILNESLRLFGERGFYQTPVQDIARAAGISRAALYQYFESREQIFVELLNVSGRELAQVGLALGRLGPHASGFRELREWLDSTALRYDRYATLFFEWANVGRSDEHIEPMVTSFERSFNRRIAGVLRDSAVAGLAAEDAAVMLTSLTLRWNYHRQLRRSPLPEGSAYHFVVLLQLMLFPGTPPRSLRPAPTEPAEWFSARPDAPVRIRRGAAAAGERYNARLASLPGRNAATLSELARSGARLFAEQGYHGTNVDEIVAGADYARATFYKYFDEKVDLLLLLSDACCQELTALGRRLGRVRDPAGLRRWVADALASYSRYRGVWSTWTDRTPVPGLRELHGHLVDAVRQSLRQALGGAGYPYPVHQETAALFVLALLEEGPEAFRLTESQPAGGDLTELVATVLERALLRGTGGR